MLLKAYNRALIRDREKTYLTTAGAAADTTLTVQSTDLAPDAASSDTWADNDYVLVGEIGQELSEIVQMSAAVTSATSLTIDREGQAGGLRYAHPVGTPVYRLDYNRVEFNRTVTDTTTGTSVLTTIRIQPDDEFTRFEDTSNTTGFGFVRFNNSTSNTFSSYSDGVNYEASGDSSSRDPRTLWTMRNKVRQLLDEVEPDSKLTDQMIDDALNDKQREIAHMRLWSFYEAERSLSIVANQFAYDIPDTVQLIHGVRFDTQPLATLTKVLWDMLHFDTDQSTADPDSYNIWNRQFLIYPRPSDADSTTAINDGSNLSASATSVTIDSSAAFNRGDYFRFIIDSEVIYATGSTSTTFTGLLRAREGTTAAIHLNDAVITERSIVYNCHVDPDDLLDTQARTDIPEPDVLTYGSAIDLAPFVGKEPMIDRWEVKYRTRIDELKEKYSSKQTAQHGRIKDMSERLPSFRQFLNPNQFPRSINP